MAGAAAARQAANMSPRIFLSLLAALSTGFALAGCAAYSSGMGPDALSLSEAEPVT
jgi:hypothetical protein